MALILCALLTPAAIDLAVACRRYRRRGHA